MRARARRYTRPPRRIQRKFSEVVFFVQSVEPQHLCPWDCGLKTDFPGKPCYRCRKGPVRTAVSRYVVVSPGDGLVTAEYSKEEAERLAALWGAEVREVRS